MPPRLGVLLAVLMWGVSFVATKAVVLEIRPAALIFARALLGVSLLSALLAARGQALVPPRDTWRELFAMGVTRGRLHGLLDLPSTRGDLLILLSTVNWAYYSTLGHPVLRRIGPTRATAGALFSGTLLLLPLVAVTGAWRDYRLLSAAGWAALLFLGLGCSGLGYLFWYGGLRRIEMSRFSAPEGVGSLLQAFERPPGFRRLPHHLRQAEVQELRLPALRHEHVRRLHVPVQERLTGERIL